MIVSTLDLKTSKLVSESSRTSGLVDPIYVFKKPHFFLCGLPSKELSDFFFYSFRMVANFSWIYWFQLPHSCFLWGRQALLSLGVCVCVCVFPPLWSKLLQVQNKPLIILLARIVPCAHSKTSYIQQRHCCPYKNHQAYLWSWKWGKITLRRNIGFVERMWSLIKIGFLIRWKEVELWMEAR